MEACSSLLSFQCLQLKKCAEMKLNAGAMNGSGSQRYWYIAIADARRQQNRDDKKRFQSNLSMLGQIDGNERVRSTYKPRVWVVVRIHEGVSTSDTAVPMKMCMRARGTRGRRPEVRNNKAERWS